MENKIYYFANLFQKYVLLLCLDLKIQLLSKYLMEKSILQILFQLTCEVMYKIFLQVAIILIWLLVYVKFIENIKSINPIYEYHYKNSWVAYEYNILQWISHCLRKKGFKYMIW